MNSDTGAASDQANWEFVILWVFYTPYSKMAANKLFFCLRVN